MGIVVRKDLSREGQMQDDPFVPEHLKGLFREFLKRHTTWRELHRKESVSFLALLLSGTILVMKLQSQHATSPDSLAILALLVFLAAIPLYYRFRRSTAHEYVNLHILYHHLLGKIEVGFCEHETGCRCAEIFKQHVNETYEISLFGNSI